MSDDGRVDFPIYLTPEQLAAIKALAARAGLSPEAWLRRAVDRSIRRDQVARRFAMDSARGWWPGLVEDA